MEQFKEFFNIFEIFDTENIDQIANNVEFERARYGDGLTYTFYIASKPKAKKDKYELKFNKTRIHLDNDDSTILTKHAYDVVFYCDDHVQLTNKYVFAQVYSNLLAGFKKLLNDYEPEGLHFYGADSSMDIMYDLFVKKYLSDESNDPKMIFYRLDKEQYISKQYLIDNPEHQDEIEIAMAKWKDIEKGYLDQKRKDKSNIREKIRSAGKVIGSFIYDQSNGYIGLASKSTPDGVMAVVLPNWTSRSGLRTKNYSFRYINETDPEDKVFYKPSEISQIDNHQLMNFLDQLFDPINYVKNKEFIDQINETVPKEIIKFISNLYYKLSDINNRNLSRFPTIEKPTGITPNKSRPMVPSIPRTRSILQNWNRYSPEQLRTGNFDDE